jgi:hypothetical protein
MIRAAFAAAALSLSGCASFNADIRSTPETVPPGDRLPLRVGVFVSEETRAFRSRVGIPGGEWLFPFGRDLADVTAETLSQIFDRAEVVSNRDYGDFDLIVEPQFDPATRVDMSLSSSRALVALTFDVTDARGSRWRKTFSGVVTTNGDTSAMPSQGQAVSKAVLAAAVAMRAELDAAKYRVRASATPSAAGASWWAK